MSTPSKDQLKERAKHLATLLREKYEKKVKHGDCIEVIAKLFGFSDWNTASAAVTNRPKPELEIPRTFGELIEFMQLEFDPNQPARFIGEELLPGEADWDGPSAPQRVRLQTYVPAITTDSNGKCNLGFIAVDRASEDESSDAIVRAINLLEQAKPEGGRPINEMEMGADLAAEYYDPNEKEPTEEEIEAAGDQWLQSQEDLRRNK